MNLKTIYKSLVWVGILLFIGGAIADANSLLYFRYVSIVGAISFIAGVLIWIPLRLRKPIIHPFNSNEYKSSADALFAFILNNFILEFWAFCFAFGMLIVIGGSATMKSSDGFQEAIKVVEADDKLESMIGQYNGTGILVSGSTGSS